MFYALRASRGLILLILPLISELENRAIIKERMNIGSNANGLKEKENPSDKDWATSKLAITERTNNSKDAITKEIKHCMNECQDKNFLLSFLLTPRHLARAISFLPSTTYR